jgi:hypothetical protein
MSAEKVVYSLLSSASAITALVGTRIYPRPLPQNVQLPALGYQHLNTVPIPTLDAAAAYGLVQSRVQVDVYAKDYAMQKTLVDEVRKACDYKRGTIAGVNVVTVLRAAVGPDSRNDDMQVFNQSVDLLITYRE